MGRAPSALPARSDGAAPSGRPALVRKAALVPGQRDPAGRAVGLPTPPGLQANLRQKGHRLRGRAVIELRDKVRPLTMSQHIFREYDIRGVAERDLTSERSESIGRGVAELIGRS